MSSTSPVPKSLSEGIALLRFPLICLIVAYHVAFPVPALYKFPTAYNCILLLKKLESVAVPAFFLFAAYFFFSKGEFQLSEYFKKLYSRTKSLLIPFFCWNLLWLLGAFIAWKLHLEFPRNPWPSADSYNWLPKFFGYTRPSTPFLEPTWFLRDLFFAIVLSPLYYFIAKRFGLAAILAVGGLWLYGFELAIPGFQSRCLFFFLLGTFFAIKKINFIEECTKLCLPAGLLWLALLIWTTSSTGTLANLRFAHLQALLLGISILGLAGILSRYSIPQKFAHSRLGNTSFFIFCAHMFSLPLLQKLYNSINFDTDWKILSVYLGVSIAAITISFFAALFLSRFFPRTFSLLNGGRE